MNSGYSAEGIGLGSNQFQAVSLPKILMPIGAGTSQYEAGEVWFMLDQYVGMPITKVEMAQLNGVDLYKYDVLVMVNGQYSADKGFVDKIKNWVAAGGTLITFKAASEWAIKNKIANEKLRPLKDSTQVLPRMSYEDATANEGSKLTGGAIFQADLDLTHPLAYGYKDRKIALYRNSNTLLEVSKNPYATVIQYDKNPLLNGYVHPATLKKIAASAGLITQNHGKGSLILFSDNPNFRGTWLGTSKLFFNALFYGKTISVPAIGQHQE